MTFESSAHDREPGGDPRDGREDGQSHGEHRPERDEEDDHRGDQPDRLRRSAERREDEHPAAGLERRAVDALPDVSDFLDALGDRFRDLRRALLELDVGVRDAPAWRDLARTFGLVRRRHDADARNLGDLRRHGLDAGSDLRIVDTGGCLDHELTGVAGALREGAFEQLLCVGRLRAFDAETLREVVADVAREHDQLARRAAAAADRADPVDPRAHLVGRVRRRRRQPGARQHRQIEQVVAHVGDLASLEPVRLRRMPS